MATNYGYDGAIRLGTTTASSAAINITKWNMSVETDALEVTDFGDKDRTYVPGLRNVTATFEGYYDEAAAPHDYVTDGISSTGTPRVLFAHLIYQNGTTKKGWKGSAVVTNVSLDVPNDGVQTISGTLQFAGGVSVFSS
jgi:hypothetical protein